MHFLGNYIAKLDAKGRVFLPVPFRRLLLSPSDLTFVARRDVYQSCIVLYPQDVWFSTQDSLRSRLNRWNSREQSIFRQFVSEAEYLTVDGSGRILIPRRLLQQLGFDSEVRFIGVDDTIEIWPSSASESFMDDSEFTSALEEMSKSLTLNPTVE